ncbi:uncharacterized protein LOC103312712 isoform X1 [Tribolium castaneum]|uniref:Uncharacterized protein n=1 Tax=Tribolium castaneum TaxID=7070 RepID=A0A139WJ70_TRICA|nr:PREDICTED: uncharacterized protein LOC103312712 isoform X1 [Tribolium castaneum]KYB28023.1 hypothetical protein TcasGA2_TC007265 [Tribolium castaneum]|eukprot:XP_008192311.1 PREDICTED: uncharacterized protein LOC103312712 isoform X1 [Tribolium castaneum]
MKTLLVACLALVALPSEQSRPRVLKRGYLLGDYHGAPAMGDLSISPSGWKGSISYLHGVHNPLPVHLVNTDDFNLNVDLPAPRRLPPPSVAHVSRQAPPIHILSSNSLEKPVMESQEYIPPQSFGTAVLPQMPPPATPVNAAASNIPANRGAVFLGSGSLGVVSLGNGAYALGSGSIGYSGNRAQPRPTGTVPVYPPLPASPNLIPAAVPSPSPQQPLGLNYDYPLLNVPQVPQVDQNGYEYLPPNRVGFGAPNPPRPLRTRQQFATPTALQVRQQGQQIPNDFQFSVPFGTTAGGIPLA